MTKNDVLALDLSSLKPGEKITVSDWPNPGENRFTVIGPLDMKLTETTERLAAQLVGDGDDDD